MLLKLIRQWLTGPNTPSTLQPSRTQDLLVEAKRTFMQGNVREAAEMYRAHLEVHPSDVGALNDLGVCYADMGDEQEAAHWFELAYSMDDSYTPAVVNHAKMLADQKKSAQALPYLREARALDPAFVHVDAVYGGICLTTYGDPKKARMFQQQAWFANFDNLRLANCYIFYSAYDDIDERQLAAEHRFWAETVRPIEPSEAATDGMQLLLKPKGRIRIGYWSPDLRNHSVRYFFRPLQEHHDKSQFEIFVYHDAHYNDAQTEHIRKASDAFHSVFELKDSDLARLIRSHNLDVLVELAGHTSNNRLSMLQERLATLQITGLGYPPTTGLTSIDAKVLDRHLMTADHAKYYAEMPLVLPSSFWCFDPMEEDAATLAPEPPLVQNGYVTFGHMGNLAKINSKTLACWREILRRVPRSRLLIRSIGFGDPAAEDVVFERYRAAGLPMERVELLKPTAGKDLFESYNDVDIILDTVPFNGGTTTCFAVYMGVPVITWAGDSLISRMGLSVMTNVDAADLVVTDADAYVRRAVALSQDMKYLRRFKQEARERMRKTGLGNGAIFAREFEQACRELLEKKHSGSLHYKPDIDLLPANEIVRRAYATMRRGYTEATHRVLAHCLRHYPNSGSAHILATQPLTDTGQFEAAAKYLQERVADFNAVEQVAALVNIARCQVLAGMPQHARDTAAQLAKQELDGVFDQCQVALVTAAMTVTMAGHSMPRMQPQTEHVHCVIPCDDVARFSLMQNQIALQSSSVTGWQITVERCSESQRIAAYRNAAKQTDADALLLLQKNIDICTPDFLARVLEALQKCDVVGFAGAMHWDRLDWNTAAFEHKAGGFFTPSREKQGFFELQVLGAERRALQPGMVVLEGSFMAARRKALIMADFDEDLAGAEALLEQAWSHAVHCAGGTLAVHRNLGIILRTDIRLSAPYWGAVRTEIATRQGFDMLALVKEDHAVASWPVATATEGLQIMERYLA